MKFLLMPLELALMVVFTLRNFMTAMDDAYEVEASPVVGRDTCAGLSALK